MRSLLALLLAVSVVACGHKPEPVAPKSEISIDKIEAKTVALVEMGEEGMDTFCSGVWVNQNEILTAHHCVDDLKIGDRVAYVTRPDVPIEREGEPNAIRFAALKKIDKDHDLALLSAAGVPLHPVAEISEADPTIGEVTQTEGHPFGLLWSYSTGNVAAIRVDEGIWYVQSTAPSSPGNSGGGLWSSSGKLIGVCHAYVPPQFGAENINLYVHVKHVRYFLAN